MITAVINITKINEFPIGNTFIDYRSTGLFFDLYFIAAQFTYPIFDTFVIRHGF